MSELPEDIFQNFLKENYREALSRMAFAGETFLVVDFEELLVESQALAKHLMDNPDEYVKCADNAALAQLQIEEPEYAESIKTVTVRFKNLPSVIPLREVGSDHIGKLIMVKGIVVSLSPAKPLVELGAFECQRCEENMYVSQNNFLLKPPNICSNPACKRKGPFEFLQNQSTFIDFQTMRIQERPEDLPSGQLPRWLEVKLLTRDMVDVARVGDFVSVTAVIRVFSNKQQRSFSMYLDSNYVDTLSKEPETTIVSLEEEQQILELSRDPWIHRKIIRSIAPSIFGYEHIKEAIAHLLFGGVTKHFPDITLRGNMNELLVGDPSTAKSQLLQSVVKVAPRGLYTSGRGTTAAGLTAAVLRAESGMILEAGALVLADKGIAAIDEMDKMRPEDRVAIHEAMEQQTISIAKGGIIATLNARTSILAAANPTLGRYDPYRTVTDNINLPVTILSRFDLIFVLRDISEQKTDRDMTRHILDLHKRGVASKPEPTIPTDLFRKYVSYAQKINPVLTEEAIECLERFYLAMRAMGETEGTPVAITTRQLESLVRIAESNARMALRKEVLVEDAETAIAMMKRSLEEVGIDISSRKFDIDVIMTGKPKTVRDKLSVILGVLTDMEKQQGGREVEKMELIETLHKNYDIARPDSEKLLSQMLRDAIIFAPKEGYLRKT